MSAVEKTNVMRMLPVTIHLVAISVIVRVDTVEMDGTVSVSINVFIYYGDVTQKLCDCFLFTDINECGDPGGRLLCDENAECNDTYGSYECVCRTGYSGDGINCSG